MTEPPPVALVLAALWCEPFDEPRVLRELERVFGPIASLRSPIFEFNQTDYYEREMGGGLRKIFCLVVEPVARDSLPELKLKAIELESRHLASDQSRSLNVDPMLVTRENVVVATSKNFPHRIYLGRGVYGDLALIRRKGRFETFPWTYADYAGHLAFFEQVHRGLR